MDRYVDKGTEAMCRTCLEFLQSDNCCSKHDVFQTPDLAKKLIVCTSLTIEAQDGFPKYLCDCCYKKIDEFHQFQTMCVESVQRFREIMQRQGERFSEFEDEKPVFDLEAQTKLEITVENSEVMLKPESCEDFLAEDLDVNVLETPPKRRSERITTKINIQQSLATESVEIDPNTSTIRSKRSTKPGFNYFERDLSEGRTDNEQEAKDSLKCAPDSLPEEHDAWASEDNTSSTSEYDASHLRDSKHEKPTRSRRKECKGRASNITRAERSKRRSPKCIGKQSDPESKSPVKKSQVYQCNVCPLRFFVEHRLVAHKRSHEGLIPYPCNFEGCDKGFNRWHCLNEHLKQHEGTNMWYTCSEEGCGKIYKHKPTLSMHLRKYHKKGPELKSHVCEICGKVFKSSAILNDHRYTHKDKSELPFACTEANCDRRFSSKEKLKVHRMRHAGIKNYICPYCGMRKTTRNELKIHINYHTLERTWPCRFCQHVCNSAGNLKMHVRTVHERAKDYACRFCERSFAKPDTRKYHEMTHTGEKPNECKECGKRFTQPAALRTHIKIHVRHRAQTTSKQESGATTAAGDGCNKSSKELTICNSSTAPVKHPGIAPQTTCDELAPSIELTPDPESHVHNLL